MYLKKNQTESHLLFYSKMFRNIRKSLPTHVNKIQTVKKVWFYLFLLQFKNKKATTVCITMIAIC